MVADLSRILATALVEYRPGFFIGVPGYETTKDVKAKKDELIEFIYQAALYHDFGKINMLPSLATAIAASTTMSMESSRSILSFLLASSTPIQC